MVHRYGAWVHGYGTMNNHSQIRIRQNNAEKKNGTEMTAEGPADVCGTQEDSNRTEKATLPTKGARATRGGKSFQYVCPHCDQSVTRTIRTGQVNHRRTCSHRFQVKDGRVFAKAYEYVCPACNGHVTSNVATGKIDHRPICGKQFSVKDGVVQEKGFLYRCPFCNGNVKSDVRTGCINHRSTCDNQFHVKDGAISKETRCHAHSCPVCSTGVWSRQSRGRTAVTHDTPAGQRCQKKQWHVLDKRVRKKRNYRTG